MQQPAARAGMSECPIIPVPGGDISLLTGKQENALCASLPEGTTGSRERGPVYFRGGRQMEGYAIHTQVQPRRPNGERHF